MNFLKGFLILKRNLFLNCLVARTFSIRNSFLFNYLALPLMRVLEDSSPLILKSHNLLNPYQHFSVSFSISYTIQTALYDFKLKIN